MNEYPEWMFWLYHFCAVFGAINIIALPTWWLIEHLAELWIQKDEPATYVQQVKRPLFLGGRYGR